MSREDLIEMYDEIYQRGEVAHPFKEGKVLEPYGIGSDRDERLIALFLDHVYKHFDEQDSIEVLDASCGRGRLMRLLEEIPRVWSYGTEVSEHLMRNDLARLVENRRIEKLAYDELIHHPRESFDCVFTNDVMEHLADELQARFAIWSFRDLAPWCCASIALRGARKWPAAMNLPVADLHTLQKPCRWWLDAFERHGFEVVYYEDTRANLKLVARRK